MNSERLPREYRIRSGNVTGLLVTSLLGVVAAMSPMWVTDVVPRWAALLVTVAFLGVCGWLIIASGRCATVADLKGIRIRGIVKQRRLSWSEIQDLQAEPNPLAQTDVLQWICYAYGPAAKRVHLLYVDNTQVNVERELAFLRSVWEELRGEDWTADPANTLRIAKRQAREMSMMVGMIVALLALVPLFVLMLLPLFTELPGFLEALLTPWLVMGVLLPGTFVVTSLVSYRRRCRGLTNPVGAG